MFWEASKYGRGVKADEMGGVADLRAVVRVEVVEAMVMRVAGVAVKMSDL